MLDPNFERKFYLINKYFFPFNNVAVKVPQHLSLSQNNKSKQTQGRYFMYV